MDQYRSIDTGTMLKKCNKPFVIKIAICNMIAYLNSKVPLIDCALELSAGRICILKGYLSKCRDASV